MCFHVYALIVCARLFVTNCMNYIRGRTYVENKEHEGFEKKKKNIMNMEFNNSFAI